MQQYMASGLSAKGSNVRGCSRPHLPGQHCFQHGVQAAHCDCLDTVADCKEQMRHNHFIPIWQKFQEKYQEQRIHEEKFQDTNCDIRIMMVKTKEKIPDAAEIFKDAVELNPCFSRCGGDRVCIHDTQDDGSIQDGSRGYLWFQISGG